MTIATSTIPAAWDHLVTAATAAFPAALVVDGPMITADPEAYQDRVTIGWDGDPESSNPAVEGDQDFNALNRTVTRDERFQIVCSVTHWDGDDNVQTARTKAFALLAVFEGMLRGYPPNGPGDTTLGGAVRWSHIAGGISAFPVATADGMAFTVVFHVSCYSRLTGS